MRYFIFAFFLCCLMDSMFAVDVSDKDKIVVAKSKKYLGRFYVKETLINLHQRPVKYAPAIATFACGDMVEAYEMEISDKMFWYWVKRGPGEGYIERENLVSKKPENCLPLEYPNFFKKMNLDGSQKYYWGRLYDLYIQRETKALVK